MRLLSLGPAQPEGGGREGGKSDEKEMVTAPASLLLGLRLAAQAHRNHFDRKHPADLNRGFGRQEEPRRNGSHLVCLSESERRRWLLPRRELLRSYTSQGLPPPFPAPSPDPFPLPRPPSPPSSPAESKVRYGASPSNPRAPSAYPFPAAWLSRSWTGEAGGQTEGEEHSPRPRTVAVPPPLRAPERQRLPPRPLPLGPPSTGTRAAWARILACWVTNGSGPFQGGKSRYSTSSPPGAASPGGGGGNPGDAEGEAEV